MTGACTQKRAERGSGQGRSRTGGVTSGPEKSRWILARPVLSLTPPSSVHTQLVPLLTTPPCREPNDGRCTAVSLGIVITLPSCGGTFKCLGVSDTW